MGDVITNYSASLGQAGGTKELRGEATCTQSSVWTRLANVLCDLRASLDASLLTGTRARRSGIGTRGLGGTSARRAGIAG